MTLHNLLPLSILKRLALIGSVVLLMASLANNTVSAATDSTQSDSQLTQEELYERGIFYFAASSSDCTASLGSVNLLGSDNIQKAYNYYVQKGLSAIAASGIVGNMMHESGVDPIKLQGGSETKIPPISDNSGWGIVQWTGSGIQQELIDRASKEHADVGDLGFQLDFLWRQLTGNPSYFELPRLKAATTPVQAADIFEQGFERAGTPALESREKFANAVYTKYGGGSVAAGGVPLTSSDSNTSNGCSGTAYTSTDFPFYSQCASKWSNLPYGGTDSKTGKSYTICDSGCGPTSMAMIVTALSKKVVTPAVMADYYHSNQFDDGGVTSWGAAPAAAKKYGLTATSLGTDVAKISAVLKTGGLVIMAGKGGLPFTTAGHFIVVRALTPNGNWLLADPDTAKGHSNTKEWDPAQVISGVTQNGASSSVYGINTTN